MSTNIKECLTDGSDCGHSACPDAKSPDDLLSSVEAYLRHDGGPGSLDYDASELFYAREDMQAAVNKARRP